MASARNRKTEAPAITKSTGIMVIPMTIEVFRPAKEYKIKKDKAMMNETVNEAEKEVV